MASRTARKVEIRKKKSSRAIARPKQSRIQGNTAGARTTLRKQAMLRKGRDQAAAAAE